LIEIKKKTVHKGAYKSFLPSKTRIENVFFTFHIPQILGREKEEAKPGTYRTTLPRN
jgi:hypothetical protein